MEEIKFRGQKLDNKIGAYGMVCGSLIFIDGKPYIVCKFGIIEVDPATVGQYTGFRDKNGKEIYKGDILTDKYESIGAVEWWEGAFVVNLGGGDVFQISDCFGDDYQMWCIGNIYDNPELLKGGEK